MPWFAVDDQMWHHPKFMGLSPPAIVLWLRAGSYCSHWLTDGIVRPETIRLLGAQQRHCTELEMAGLWHPIPDGGYAFHDWAEYQKTSDWWEAKRIADAKRQRRKRGAAKRDAATGQFTPANDEIPEPEDDMP